MTHSVYIVDNSAYFRMRIKEGLTNSDSIEIIGASMDPYVCAQKIKIYNPKVILLDIEMITMDSIAFLNDLFFFQPKPVIIMTYGTEKFRPKIDEALSMGAIKVIHKPHVEEMNDKNKSSLFFEDLQDAIANAVTSKVKPKGVKNRENNIFASVRKLKNPAKNKIPSDNLIALGSSTGGTKVITTIIQNVHETVPAIVIVQHMPEGYTKMFTDKLNMETSLVVKEAKDGESLYRGFVYVAPGGKHVVLDKDNKGYFLSINDDAPVNRFKPSVDKLFISVAQKAGKDATAIILTGMGDDGVKGMNMLKKMGAETIAQDEQSSVVYGMNRQAIECGAATKVLTVSDIIHFINSLEIK